MTFIGIQERVRSVLMLTARARRRRMQVSLADRVDEARKELMLSRRYLASVSDPELVEHARYLMQVAERRYHVLLSMESKLRRQNV